ncbi:MAG: hypothetical protein ACRDHW_12505, partial [Ktedonobacteraceae bacterium]
VTYHLARLRIEVEPVQYLDGMACAPQGVTVIGRLPCASAPIEMLAQIQQQIRAECGVFLVWRHAGFQIERRLRKEIRLTHILRLPLPISPMLFAMFWRLYASSEDYSARM